MATEPTDNFPIKELVIHCSDTPDSNTRIDAAEIDRWHKAQGWNSIGYHWVVKRDGAIEEGRKPGVIGAHTYGYNRHRLGVCWIGRDTPEPEQYLTLIHLAACLVKKFGLPFNQGAATVAVKGHREFENQGGRTCPNLDLNQVRKDVLWRLKELEGVKDACDLVGAVCGRH